MVQKKLCTHATWYTVLCTTSNLPCEEIKDCVIGPKGWHLALALQRAAGWDIPTKGRVPHPAVVREASTRCPPRVQMQLKFETNYRCSSTLCSSCFLNVVQYYYCHFVSKKMHTRSLLRAGASLALFALTFCVKQVLGS